MLRVLSRTFKTTPNRPLFNRDQILKLQNIIDYPFVEKEMAKHLLCFQDILEIKFVLVSKSVLNILKV